MSVLVILNFDGDDPVVALLLLFLFALFSLDYAYGPAFDQAAGVGGLIHQDQHIGGIAVFGFGGRNEAEVVRESHAGRQNLFQLENSLLIIEGEFITTPFGSFDDDLNEIFVFEITRGENAGVGKAFLGP